MPGREVKLACLALSESGPLGSRRAVEPRSQGTFVLPYRLNRLFHPESGRSLSIAVDHGTPGEPDLLEGIEEMEPIIDALVEANPDALLLTPGQADLLQRRVGRTKPALVLRVDTGNVFGREIPERPASWMYDDAVGLAVRL